MDLVSNDKILEEANDFQEEEDSDFVGKLDLNLVASKDEEGNGICSNGNAARNDGSYEMETDLNQREPRRTPMLPADGSSRGVESPQMKPRSVSQSEALVTDCLHYAGRETDEPPSLVRSESYHDDVENQNLEYGLERFPSPPKNNHSSDEADAVCFGDYSVESSSPLPMESFRSEKKTENTLLSVVDNANNEQMIETRNSSGAKSPDDREAMKYSDHFSRNQEFEKMDTAYESENRYHAGKDLSPLRGSSEKKKFQYSDELPTENREMEAGNLDLHSPARSPGTSPSIRPSPGKQQSSPVKGVEESSHFPCLSRQRHSPSPERRTMDGTRVNSHECLSPLVEVASTSPARATKRDSQRRNRSPRNSLSVSPKRRHSPPGHREQDRSASRSPIRRKVSPRGYRKDYRDRSRSRSPYARDRHRGPRRTYSPRRRSPRGYNSRRRSPRRRPWSPPPNRSTGVGRPGKNLFIAGFSFVTTERDLERKFSRFGHVTGVRIVRDKRTGDSRGFGFLSLERDEDADAAIRALDQTEWNGRIVLVEKSKTSAR